MNEWSIVHLMITVKWTPIFRGDYNIIKGERGIKIRGERGPDKEEALSSIQLSMNGIRDDADLITCDNDLDKGDSEYDKWSQWTQ